MLSSDQSYDEINKGVSNTDSLLLARYEADRKRISRDFFEKKDPGSIICASGSGDKHLHGEAVTKIETSGGHSLYYKPRDCRSTDLCGDLAELLFGERMVPEQISGDGYAFQKNVEKRLPDTEVEKEEYYEKLGRLTALFYALGSTDMHNGNILCAGARPVVIDTETLLYAKAEGFAGNGEFSLDYGEIFPDLLTSAGESMVLPRFYGYMQTSPLLPGKDHYPEGYEPFFIEGFKYGYRKICEKKEEIIRILETYKDAPFRYVLRSTQYYSLKIAFYRNAKEEYKKESVLNSLEKGLSETELKRWAPVLEWERECIREGDVPYFCLKAGVRDLYGDADEAPLIPDFTECSPIEYAMWRMGRMNEQDLKIQTAYIQAGLKHIDRWEKPEEDHPDPCSSEALAVSEAVREAEETLLKLWEERVELSDGCCLWHTPFINGKTGCMFSLAEGFSGIAVFAHACAASPLIKGEAGRIAKELSAACFRDLASFGEYLLKTYPIPPEERIISRRFNGDFGFSDGLSGLLWALEQCRDEDPKTAEKLLNGFDAWQIRSDETDVPALLQAVRKPAQQKEEEADPRTAETTVLDETDCLEGGNAGKAAEILFRAGSGRLSGEEYVKAGVILKNMVDRKKEQGFYRVFRKGRHSYFLPAFLCGNTGIAYVLLHYAQNI